MAEALLAAADVAVVAVVVAAASRFAGVESCECEFSLSRLDVATRAVAAAAAAARPKS